MSDEKKDFMSTEPYMTPNNLLIIEDEPSGYSNHQVSARDVNYTSTTPAGFITRVKGQDEESMSDVCGLSTQVSVVIL